VVRAVLDRDHDHDQRSQVAAGECEWAGEGRERLGDVTSTGV